MREFVYFLYMLEILGGAKQNSNHLQGRSYCLCLTAHTHTKLHDGAWGRKNNWGLPVILYICLSRSQIFSNQGYKLSWKCGSSVNPLKCQQAWGGRYLSLHTSWQHAAQLSRLQPTRRKLSANFIGGVGRGLVGGLLVWSSKEDDESKWWEGGFPPPSFF